MDNYDKQDNGNNNNWAAITSLSIGLAEGGGILLAYLIKTFSHYFYGIEIPPVDHPSDNPYIDAMINELINGLNAAMRAAGPVLEEFFRFFFSSTIAWVFIALSIFGFIFGIIGLRSKKTKAALAGMLISAAVMVFGWWIISQAQRGV